MISFFENLGRGENGFWLCLGFVSQVIFFTRFFVQWVVSEIKKKSVIPISFWYLSIAGSLGLMAYSIYRKDPVFIAGQSLGLVIYIRNLFFISKNKSKI
ncbi:MAG: lipid-A-disaccharide synthase N-terminal domain-containing protein [Candidatus Omnitrophica bacterium]|nr:lipid-A-disaccharide synthase N-terminal domain-containing protein [Candidatus Omnitrophota bacterium]MCK5288776.1 lipid-A-disaccharide synthase N-terminal domain-containing protein [Candidatus Omnitrophota bacterium]MCK5393307.1 lipid-A-disaccharide synthase N-terminal domain-containing protein [Candidatus Omnitrophota bacterium]